MDSASRRLAAPSAAERKQLRSSLEQRIGELNEEAAMFGDPAPSSESVASLMGLADGFLPWVVAKRLPLPSVFLRDGGTLELVVLNPPISRRLTAHLSKDGRSYVVILLDGRGAARDPAKAAISQPISSDWMEWLCP